MLKYTDIKRIQATAVDFLNLEPQQDPIIPLLAMHPFFEYSIIFNGKKNIDIFEDKNGLAQLRAGIEKNIWKANSANGVIFMIRESYKLTFLKFIKSSLSLEDFSELLGEVYVNSENPNDDQNVSISTLVRWFKQAKKEALMNEEELKGYNSLPDHLIVYRGVAVDRKRNGISWTTDLSVAKWFADRFNTDVRKGYVLRTEISKADVLAFFSRRGEKEIVCKPEKERIRKIEEKV